MNASPPSVPPNAVKLAIPLSALVYEALQRAAKADRREPTDYIQRILTNHVIDLLPAGEQARVRANWAVVEEAVAEAKKICRDGKFSKSITLDAIRTCTQRSGWIKTYENAVGDNPLKGPLNREIGFRIRAAIGGTVEKDAAGNPIKAKVLGEVIQSYTPMTAYDPAMVEAG